MLGLFRGDGWRQREESDVGSGFGSVYGRLRLWGGWFGCWNDSWGWFDGFGHRNDDWLGRLDYWLNCDGCRDNCWLNGLDFRLNRFDRLCWDDGLYWFYWNWLDLWLNRLDYGWLNSNWSYRLDYNGFY